MQRWLKFTKYLPEFNWQPYVFTPENPSFEVKDFSLEADISSEVEVIKLPILEPYSIFKIFKGKGSQQSDLVKKKKKSAVTKLLLWVRGNVFIPDPRVFWVKPAVKVLQDLIAANGIDVVITTGPPHSMHLIGMKLKKKTGVKWVADFRDPWTTWDLMDSFYLSKLARNRHKKLEKEVLQTADAVVSVSKNFAADLIASGGRHVEVITNGFDEDEFKDAPEEKPSEFIIRHIGVVDELRDPRPFLRALKELAEEGNSYKMEFIGNVNETLKEEVQDDDVLSELVSFRPYMPHAEVVKLYRESAVLLLLSSDYRNAPGHVPGKLFEYLASGRPILASGSANGDAAGIIRDAGAGVACDSNDVEAMKSAIRQFKEQFDSPKAIDKMQISQYSRRNLTKRLAALLDTL